MKICFLRHGETEWNRERRLQGSTEWTELTDFGVRLAEMTLDGMRRAGLAFDRVYTSPYRRARHTAEIVAAGFDLAPIVDDRIREMAFGEYEGSRISDGNFADENIRACFRDPERYVARGVAESFDAVADRIRDFLDRELRPLESSCQAVLVIAHGGVMRTVRRLLAGVPLADYWKGRQPNCCVHEAELKDGVFSLVAEARVFYDQNLAASVPSV